jgi:RecA-family ATPase
VKRALVVNDQSLEHLDLDDSQPEHHDIDQIPNVFSFDCRGIRFAVEGLIACASVTMFSGESGHGKSTFVSALADAVTKGREFCGRKCVQLPVLMLDRENGIDTIQERFTRLGIPKDDCRITVWGGWCDVEPPGPVSPAVVAWVTRKEPKPLVVVDSAAAFMEGDENSASEVRKFMDKLRKLAHLGATVICLHNSGKAETSKDYRGSSDFKASIDIGINVRNSGEGELKNIVLKAFKSRFAIDREIILKYAHGSFLADDRPFAAVRTDAEQLTELLRQNRGITKTDFEKAALGCGLARNKAREYIENGERIGEIQVVRGKNNSQQCFIAESASAGAE